ncbi:MAG: Crp/Fnr family transcriptional regulator [Legionellales bacterium]|nr:Crp/Fnr family transcriptional regulator [Legionellales bacterium]
MISQKLLQNIELFSKLNPENIDRIVKSSTKKFYKKGNIILNNTLIINNFLYVINGWVKFFNICEDGEESIIDILTKNNFHGEQFIFQKPLNNNCYSSNAITNVEALIIPLYIIKECINNNHKFSVNFLQTILEKQHNLNMEIEHLNLQNAVQKIGCFILRLCSINEGNTTVELPYNKTLLAARLGMQPETFSRALAKFHKQCNIDINKETVYIHDIEQIINHVCEHCTEGFPCKNNI